MYLFLRKGGYMTDKKKKDKMITLTELKKRYGITDKLVKEFFQRS